MKANSSSVNQVTNARRSTRSTDIDQRAFEWSTSVDQNLELLRQAVHDTDHTLDSLAAHMRIGRAYIGKVLNNEKPLRLEFEVALPRDVIASWREKQAESFGFIVVRPLSGMDAMKAAVSGLIGIMSASTLPARADAMAKASLPVLRTKASGE